MQKRWVLRDADEGIVSHLSKTLAIPPLIARILALRGVSEIESAKRFLSSSLRSDLPSPFLMAGMKEAVERLCRALEGKEPICVWGDYDVDGTTGSSALISFLKEVGEEPAYYIPHRLDEGYGLNEGGIRRLSAQGVKVVVTVDCGMSNVQEADLARTRGVDLIIVDHHEPPSPLPAAVAILNPHRSDCSFPDTGLSGAGLAFYLIIGLRARLRESGWFHHRAVPDVRRYLDVVTLGTIADMVPLKGVNRVLARRGLMELGSSSRPGVVALKQVAGISSLEVSTGHVAFKLGPRINAAGRMDHGRKVVEMLTTDSLEQARRIAEELEQHNRERQEVEARVLGEAVKQAEQLPGQEDRLSFVVGAEGWHPGVVGIVASRLVERFYRPAVVVGFAGEEGKGSARSIRGFHVVEGFRRCAELLEKFGGHEMAGGLSIKREKFSLFAERFEEVVRSSLNPEDLVPMLEVDAQLDFRDIQLGVVRQVRGLGPFGVGNPEPLFLSRGIELVSRRDFNGGARFRLRQSGRMLGGVGFRETRGFPSEVGARIDVVYQLIENQWNGTYAPELRLVDARLARE